MVKNEDLITIWGLKREELNSEYGKITYENWCKREIVRINKGDNRKVELVERGFNEVAIAQIEVNQ